MSAGSRALARLVLSIALLLVASLAAAQDPRASVVVAAARSWLDVVDRSDAQAAYSAAGEKFRESMPVDVWSRALAKERGERGKLVQRTIVNTSLGVEPPGAPPGEYAMVVYRTPFERHSGATETITLERERDGVWRVVGYVIR